MPETKKLTIYLNGTEIAKYRDGVTVDFAFNEELDSGVLIVPALTSKLTIKRNDVIQMNYANGNSTESKYYLVAGFNWELETDNNPQTYTYTIQLASITMLLQNDLMPNITITQPLTGDKRTIYWEIQRLNKILGSKYSLATFLQQRTINVTCPEFQWNKRNLWEILNDLLAVVDCVVTMTNPTTISCLRYQATGEAIPASKIIDIKYHEDPNEYCTELEMNAENVIGDNVTTVSQEWITPRASDYILTTKNARILLEKEIYYIENVLLKLKLPHDCKITYNYTYTPPGGVSQIYISTYTYTINSIMQFDISKFVVEEEIYATKLPTNVIGHFYDYNWRDKKRYFLSYKQGSTFIDNICYTEKEIFNIESWPTIYNILDNSICDYFMHVTLLDLGIIPLAGYEINWVRFEGNDWKDFANDLDMREFLFKVNYTSLNSIRFRTAKQNSSNLNPKVLASNQGASYVDAKALGLSEQANANRIGNPYYELTLRDYVPSVNDYYLDNGSKYYLTQCSLQINNIGDYYFKGQFVKDFVRKNLFTGINSKARWTSIAKGSEALLRQDIVKIKMVMSQEVSSTYRLSEIIRFIWTYLGQAKKEVALVKTDVVDDYFYLPISAYLLGNNHIIMEFRFQDNVSAGNQVSSTDTNAYICQGCKYVDDNGEFRNITFEITDFEYTDTDELTRGQKYPVAYYNGSKVTAFFGGTTNRITLTNTYKDNREIYGICIGLEIVSQSSTLTIYDRFYEMIPMVLQSDKNIYAYVSTEEEEITVTELVHFDDEQDRYVVNNSIYIEFQLQTFCNDHSILIDDVTAWGFCDGDDRKMIESTDTSISGRKIYMNKATS